MTKGGPGMRLNAAQVDRAIGALVGAACGDALGAGYEFGSAPLEGDPQMIGGGLGNFAPGEWTDDTSQTYAIAKVAATGADLREESALDEIAQGFADWMSCGPPDVGIQTRMILGEVGAHPSAAQMRAAAEQLHRRGSRTAGNGSLMRTSCVALAHLDDPQALVEAAHQVAALTHYDPLGADACALWCLAIRHAVLLGELPVLVDLVDFLHPDRRDFWRTTVLKAESDQPQTFRPNGYVVTALQAAWSAISHTPIPLHDPAAGSFSCQHLVAGLNAAIAIGDDTDTVASIAGALLGARWGYSSIPWQWRRILHGWPGVRNKDLHDVAVLTIQGGKSDAQGWPTAGRIDYSSHQGYNSFATHPHDPDVYISGAATLDALPSKVTAVVSLARLGAHQIPSHIEQIDIRLIDTSAADNPNIHFAINEGASAVRALRAEGHVVLLHCVAAQSRTPVVATRYSTLLGYPLEQALAEVQAVLPAASPNPVLMRALRDLAG